MFVGSQYSMSKMISKSKSTNVKRKKRVNVDKTALEDKTTKLQEYREYLRSYRFDSEIMDTLNATLGRVNKISPKKVKEARLIKALILLSRELDENLILKAIKEVW